jgi:hypothetical protein
MPVPRLSIVLAASLCAAASFAAPAHAQDPGEKVNQLIVYGQDPCPQSKDDEITVCARKAESERYRIPEPLRESTSPENRAWTDKVVAYETVGSFGTMSCSPTGPGGSTGCLGKLINTAYAEKKSDPSIHFSELIAAERAKRLSTIDQEAAETQARVEQAEKEYDAKQRASQDPENPKPAPAPAGK